MKRFLNTTPTSTKRTEFPCLKKDGAKMGDDTCKPHDHFGRDGYNCHHFRPHRNVSDYGDRTIWRCPFCGNARASVTADVVSRRYRDRLP